MTRLGEDEFNKIKKLFADGYTYKEIMGATHRSYSVIYRANRSKTYEDYASDIRQRHRNLEYKRVERARNTKVVDQATFDLIKKAQNNGLTLREIQEIFDFGHCTIERIKASETLDEYKKLTNDKRKYTKNTTATKDDKLDAIKNLLEQILEKLDSLEIPNKKKWFK